VAKIIFAGVFITTMSSAQALVRVGSPLDIYYQDADNAKKQVIPTLTDQRYTQEFTNKGQGTSVFTIPPKMIGCVLN